MRLPAHCGCWPRTFRRMNSRQCWTMPSTAPDCALLRRKLRPGYLWLPMRVTSSRIMTNSCRTLTIRRLQDFSSPRSLPRCCGSGACAGRSARKIRLDPRVRAEPTRHEGRFCKWQRWGVQAGGELHLVLGCENHCGEGDCRKDGRRYPRPHAYLVDMHVSRIHVSLRTGGSCNNPLPKLKVPRCNAAL